MESIPVFGQESNLPTEEGSSYPKRFAALFMANGVNKHHFWAKQSEEGMILGKSLEPLAPYRRKMNVISGLFNKNATGWAFIPGRPETYFPVLRCRKGRRSRVGSAWIRCLPTIWVNKRCSPAWCWAVNSLSRGIMRPTFPWLTGRTFRGKTNPHQFPWRCIRPWLSIVCSRTRKHASLEYSRSYQGTSS